MLAVAAAAPGSKRRWTVVDDDVGLDLRLELLLPGTVVADMGTNSLGKWESGCLAKAVVFNLARATRAIAQSARLALVTF